MSCSDKPVFAVDDVVCFISHNIPNRWQTLPLLVFFHCSGRSQTGELSNHVRSWNHQEAATPRDENSIPLILFCNFNYQDNVYLKRHIHKLLSCPYACVVISVTIRRPCVFLMCLFACFREGEVELELTHLWPPCFLLLLWYVVTTIFLLLCIPNKRIQEVEKVLVVRW